MNSSNVTHVEQRVRQILWDVVPPVIIGIGLIFNAMSLVVLNRPPLRKLNVSASLSVLAIVDTLVLCTGLTRHWLRKCSYVGIDVQELSRVGCKLHEFLVYFTLCYSSWIVMGVALERYLTVCVNTTNKFRNWMTTRRGLAIVLATFGTWCFLINCHFFYTRELVNGNDCTDIKESIYFKQQIWTWVDFTQNAIIPFSMIVFCNVSLLIKVCRASRASIAAGGRQQARNSRITTMLLLVSFAFLVCAFPVKLYLICYPMRGKMPQSVKRYSRDYYGYRLAWTVVLLFQYTNNAINFFLYCASNSIFRREFATLFCGAEIAENGCGGRGKSTSTRLSRYSTVNKSEYRADERDSDHDRD